MITRRHSHLATEKQGVFCRCKEIQFCSSYADCRSCAKLNKNIIQCFSFFLFYHFQDISRSHASHTHTHTHTHRLFSEFLNVEL